MTDDEKLRTNWKDQEMTFCDHCQKDVAANDFNKEFEICVDCVDELPNETAFCSISCRLGRGCDGSC